MITRGLVSIDVEVDDVEESMYYNNNQHQHHYQQSYPYGHAGGSYHHHPPSPLQWSEEDVQEDMIRHSVTFPMVPQCSSWPGGGVDVLNDSSSSSSSSGDDDTASNEDTIIGDSSCIIEGGRFCAVRALRILPETCRVLSSATRCPFLVRMEVIDTGLDADDIRLYYNNNNEKEDDVIQSQPSTKQQQQQKQKQQSQMSKRESSSLNAYETHSLIHSEYDTNVETPILSRGGGVYPDHAGSSSSSVTDYGYDSWPDTYDTVREQHYEELHHTLRQRREVEFDYMPRESYNNNNINNIIQSSISIQQQQQQQHQHHQSQQLSTGSVLLDNVFGRPWNDECELIRQQSPYRNVKGWRLASFIIKAGEDIRREALVMQCITKLWTWFQDEIPDHLRPYLRPYTIMCVGGDAGIVECLSDVKSVNEIKKETDGFTTLRDFFERAYGPPSRQANNSQQQPSNTQMGVVSFEKARDNFLRSLVGYSVVCYILQIKDRHNANILMDREGHIMHIDFGFVLGETPKMGKLPLFSERAPFKLSAEFWEVIGGWASFKRFCEMFEAAYAVASAHSDEICSLVEAAIMNVSRNTDLARSIADGVRGRMQMKADPKEQKIFIINIVNDAITSWGTSTYDWLQRSMHGYQ
jgi:phosphatidylinositol 4-kinase